MSNPFIQFELDAAKKAPTLASALGIEVRSAFGGLTMMWLRAYSEKVETVTAFYLRSFFGADGAMVGEALVELGFAERLDASTWRVRGAGRYDRLAEIRSEAGKKGREKQLAEKRDSGSTGHRAGKTGQKAVLPEVCPGKDADSDRLPEPSPGKTGQKAVLPGQKRALEPIADRLLLTQQQPTHESPVGGPPQDAPRRGRPVAPPKPEPEPEPEWQPLPLCAAGLHNQHPNDKACVGCARVEREKVAAEKQRLKQEALDRIAAIPMPPRDYEAEGLGDDEALALMSLYASRLRLRDKGLDWREAMQ